MQNGLRRDHCRRGSRPELRPPCSWQRPDGASPSWRRRRSRGERCAESSFRKRPGRCCGSWALPVHCWKSPAPRCAASASTPPGDGDGASWGRPPGGRRAAAERWAANTSIRCCSSAPPRPGRRFGSPARSSQFVDERRWLRVHHRRQGHAPVPAFCDRGSIVAAHGSWESGPMPTQDLRRPPRPSDLFGFKASFIGGALPPDLMPLLAFPGGYGGMVHTDGGRVSLSCCIRRDQLERCRRQVAARTSRRSGSPAYRVVMHGRRSGAGSGDAGRRLAVLRTAAHGNSQLRPRRHLRGRQCGRRSASHRRRRHQHRHSIGGVVVRAIDRPPGTAARRVRFGPRARAASGTTTRWPGATTFHGGSSWRPHSRTCSCGLFPRASPPPCWNTFRNCSPRAPGGAARRSRCAARARSQGTVVSTMPGCASTRPRCHPTRSEENAR